MADPTTIHDLRATGWTVGMAHGSVEAEEQALELARRQAQPAQVDADVAAVAAQVAATAANAGVTGHELVDLIARAAGQALTEISAARSDLVVFHERALEIARQMPDVWCVTAQVARDDDGDGQPDTIRVYVATAPDGTGADDANQATLDQLHALPVLPEGTAA